MRRQSLYASGQSTGNMEPYMEHCSTWDRPGRSHGIQACLEDRNHIERTDI